jgi:hypothetical protein
MRLSEFKKCLNEITALNFMLPDGQMVPSHFHITEIGQVSKHFIDCGGTVRQEKTISVQLWEANDLDHRLAVKKLQDIIALSESRLGLEDAEMEVEYQGETIGKYGLEFGREGFHLVPLFTNCLASDHCGIPQEKLKIDLRGLQVKASNCCTPGGGCC